MEKSLYNQHYLKNEKIQAALRIAIVSLFSINFIYLYTHQSYYGSYTLSEVLFLPGIVILSNIFYFFFLQKYPNLYQYQRIVLTMSLDILATILVFYLIGNAGIYYPGVLLWFIIGYSARYGLKIGYIAYCLVLISWYILIEYSPFWQMHLHAAIGWFIAYLILPLYYFKLISQLQETIKKLNTDVDKSTFLAGHDILTKLPNRYLFDKTLKEYINEYGKKEKKFALFFIDLDKFKEINDLYGHDVGDNVLIEASKRINEIGDFTARLGGDEFVSIIEYTVKDDLKKKALQLIENINKECSNPNISLAASIGVSCFPDDSRYSYDLKKYSDKAMYRVKQSGKNQYAFYNDTVGGVALDLN